MLQEGLASLASYLLHITPGLVLCALWFLLTPKTQPGLRILILLLAFVLVRDAMTPTGLWSLDGQVCIGFLDNPLVLAALGLMSLGLVALLRPAAPGLWSLILWRKGNLPAGLALGLLAGCAIGILLRLYQGTGFSGFNLWLAGMLLLAYGGNALEEVLFRGLLQGYLEQHATPLRAALGSAVAFAACHVFLASTVTQAGWPVLAFTLVEGLACALVRMRYGVIPAIATHGTAILLIAVPY
ncbi:CPBP family intramembrane glutamic endopeptidase [Pseudomonas sp. 148P]|uniref:CPBP family intramembrane glutamic endopeptidase n=1 Tax=Pseudomonas ulcerans TaxID=3115852 RepID=A0ABU7HW96_9PSED|nr:MULTISPECIES: CPBP family intramembrane glutamic endopeptidase [unclassified Pseudomonas]MEE1924681.1 CPBP family intramembrane glutamic endopeptidase [Pseudomonas sp. 147P]MEE1935805.1 CPBP family intramembrane glutamic endopeptidase [Pseudomonas sp. 148P]